MKTKSAAKKPVSIDPAQAAFDVRQAALYLGLSHWQVRMAVWQGKLPARKVGKALLILRADADAFLKSLPPVPVNSAEWLQRRTVSEVRQ